MVYDVEHWKFTDTKFKADFKKVHSKIKGTLYGVCRFVTSRFWQWSPASPAPDCVCTSGSYLVSGADISPTTYDVYAMHRPREHGDDAQDGALQLEVLVHIFESDVRDLLGPKCR